jgi:hypothetical protein
VTGNSNHPSDEQLVLFFYGDADGSDTLAAHVDTCEACRATLRTLERTLAAVDRHRVPERGAGYAGEVWARVQGQLEQQPSRNWFAWLTPRRLLLAGAAAMLLVAAFVAGRYSSAPPSKQTAEAKVPGPVEPANGSSQPHVRDRVLLVAVGDHLQRSQMVLIELMNKPAEGPVDISGTQEWARDLVPTNRLIRETANEAGEPVVADVLDDLERTLVELANSPSQLSTTEFEQVRRRIEGQGLVFKIRVLDSQVRERERNAPHAVRSRS